MTTIYMDEDSMSKILMNLLKNSYSFTVKTVKTESMIEALDSANIEYAFENKCILLTSDKRIEKIIKKIKNRPARIIINQNIIQKKAFGYLIKKLSELFIKYSPEKMIELGLLSRIY